MTPLLFIVCAIAVYRIAILISLDDGPADVVKKMRQSIPRQSSAWKGIRCFRCCSIWAAIPVTIWVMWNEAPPLAVIYGLALSGAAVALNRVTEHD